ncbi:MBG domain-containing protein [Allosphingosinicella vermicomposti]|uniref:MBG domain-containing protein n=1 Tax=Allosphingosinicella vermicomposti TaxID=614671 RepID=UPI000D0E8A6E|nr:MBG domain-containing protein [Allosphingosinicella vermicomposti]
MTVAPNPAATRHAVATHVSDQVSWRLLGTTALVPPLLIVAAPASAQVALPSGGNVVSGDISIGTPSGGVLNIEQFSNKGIIEWQTFSIGENEKVHFNNGSGATLNRVKGTSTSYLNGEMTATGSVYLINSNGIVVGKDGVINVGGSFVGSTLGITNENFQNGSNEFNGPSTEAVVNLGQIGAAGGDIILGAMKVENHGTLIASNGTVGLAAGSTFTFANTAHADGRLRVAFAAPSGTIHNHGTIQAAVAELRANGGNIFALAGATQGIIRATGVASVDGRVFLTAGTGGVINTSSTEISALTKSGAGGTITIGDAKGASVSIGTGTVLIGASVAGAGGTIGTSSAQVTVAGDAVITTLGNGGATGNWLISSRDFTVGSAGNISGTALSNALDENNVTIRKLAGTVGGTGDIIVNDAITWEGSTKLTLAAERDIHINANITAYGTDAGLVLDHGAGRDYFVNLDNSARITLTGTNATLNIEGQNYTLIHDINQLQDMDLNRAGYYALAENINASATAGWNNGDGSKGFKPIGEGTFGFTGILTGLGNSIDDLMIDAREFNGGKAVGLVTNLIGSIRDTRLLNGSISGTYLVGAFAGFGSGDLLNVRSNSHVSGKLDVGGLMGHSTGTIRKAQALTGASVTGQLNVGGILGRGGSEIDEFILDNVISRANVVSYGTGDIFEEQILTGENTGGVLGLSTKGMINDTHAYGEVQGTLSAGGLIGRSEHSTVTNSSTDNVVSSANWGGNIGGLIGFTIGGTVTYSHSDGLVSGGRGTGGLIGTSLGAMISHVTSSADVTGARLQTVGLGGLVGVLWSGTLTDSTAIGGLVQGWIDYGGLVGTNRGTILNSSSANHVLKLGIDDDRDDFAAGGLVGTNYGLIRNSSSSSSVDGRTAVGGLVGYNFDDGITHGQIFDSSASGAVTATRGNVGGLIGTNEGLVSRSSASGTVFGVARAGGLVGANHGAQAIISESRATGKVSSPVDGDPTQQGYEVGGLAGYNYAGARIERSYATGGVEGSNAIGGLVGRNLNSVVIDSYATGRVQGNYWVGGLVGVNSGMLTNAFASGDVFGNTRVGGLVGENYKPVGVDNVLISHAYASGEVIGDNFVGGLVGVNTEAVRLAYSTGSVTLRGISNGIAGGLVGENSGAIDFTYAAGVVTKQGQEGILGGLVGRNGTDEGSVGVVRNSYWNLTTSGVQTSDGGEGRTDAQMRDQRTFAGWDIAGTWAPADGTYMPELYGVSGVVGVYIGELSRIYGDDNSVLSGAPISYIGDGFWNSRTGTGSFSTSTDRGTNVGSYAISGSGVSGTRQIGGASRIAYVGTLKINKRDITVTALGGSSIYGDVVTNPGLSAVGLVNGQDASVLTGLANSFNLTQASDAGTYTLSVDGVLTNANYNVTDRIGGQWVIGKRALTVTALGGSSTYGDVVTNPGLLADNLVNGDTVEELGLSNSFNLTQASDAGTYTLTVNGSLIGDNYEVTRQNGQWVIGKRDITVTALGGSSIYGDVVTNPGLSAVGLVNGQDASVLTGLANSFNLTQASDAGTYTLSVDGVLTNANYNVTDRIGGQWVIGKRALTVTALGGSSTYGDVVTNPGLLADNLVNGDTVEELGLSNSFNLTQASDAGTYTLTVNGSLIGDNYEVTRQNGQWVIGKRDITVTALGGSSIYGDVVTNPGLSAVGLVNGDTVEDLLGLSNSFNLTSTDGVGSYTLTVVGELANNNYTVTERRTGTWVIDRRGILVTVVANDFTRKYGEANPIFTYTATGLLGEDELTGELFTKATQYSKVGDYVIELGSLSAGDNYSIAFTPGTLTILPRNIVVTAHAQSRTYGDANPALTYTVSGDGLVNGDLMMGGLSTLADIRSNVGSYAIGLNDLTAGGNYAISYVGNNVQVTPRALLVTASNQSRVYGDGNPALTYVADGLVNGDTLSGTMTTTATTTSNVGNYAITQGGLTASGNYVMTFKDGVLQVTPRALIVTAKNQSRQYGDANPLLGFDAIGLVNGDQLLGDLATEATATSNVGAYAITQGGLTASGNYTLTFRNGSLQVVPRTLIVTADNKVRNYGEANPEFTFTAQGLVNNDTLTGGLTTAATTNSRVGNYAITNNGLSAGSNYDLRFVGATLRVMPRPATGQGDDPTNQVAGLPVIERHIPNVETDRVSAIRFLRDCSPENETLSIYPANLPAQPAPCPLTSS